MPRIIEEEQRENTIAQNKNNELLDDISGKITEIYDEIDIYKDKIDDIVAEIRESLDEIEEYTDKINDGLERLEEIRDTIEDKIDGDDEDE